MEVVRLCAAMTCIRFYNGTSSCRKFLEAMGIATGAFTSSGLADKEKRRLMEANRKATDKAKKPEREGV